MKIVHDRRMKTIMSGEQRTTIEEIQGTSKNQFRWFFEVPCGACLLGEGLTINGLRYSGACPFPQTPIPLRFFEVPCGACLLG